MWTSFNEVYNFFDEKSTGGAVKSEIHDKPTISRRITQAKY